jgi:signal transduction histidine kinase
LPPVLENAIYRIAQESLNNACQHSRSKKVLMTLVQDGDVIRLEVRDWGRGFDPAAVRQGMLGLEGIRERARLLDGTAVIDSQRRQGTTVRVTLPLPASVAARGCRLAGALRDGGPAR